MQHPFLNIAIKAARRAGNIITRYLGEIESHKVQEKKLNDLVTFVDKACEDDIIETIHRAFPNHAILGEETGFHDGTEEYTWVIDPLDGTMNYVHGFPNFAVSIGIKHRDQVEHAVIYDPLRQDLYVASRGRGALLNDRRIRVSKYHSLVGTLLGTSYPFQNDPEALAEHFKIFNQVFPQCADIRHIGSAALNLAYTAAGRLDGFWEAGVKEWDVAAGSLLVREAGGFVTDYQGDNGYLENGTIIAAAPKVHAELLKIIEQCKVR